MLSENQRTEFKLELTDQLEKEVVGFLNSREGGDLLIGVADDGQIVGVDDIDSVQRKIVDRIRNNIVPPVMGLYEVLTEAIDDRQVIRITVLSGAEKPYYIRSKGMSPDGVFIRVGSSTQPMTIDMIESVFSKRTRTSLKNIPSPHQNLSFAQLKIYYEENDLPLTDQFARNLDLLTEDGKFNYFAYLLADSNGVSIKIAKYSGSDKSDLVENKEFGYCSLIKVAFNVLNRFDIENVPMTKITSSIREETYPVDPISLREAIINAIVHNDFAREISPVFEIYSDKIVITSAGGLPSDLSEDEFYQGFSAPRNRELMRVFKDVQLVEHIGSGIPRILKKYERSIFNFSANFLRITFPVPEAVIARMNAIDADKVPISADKVPIGADKMLVENPQYLKIINYLGSHESVTNSIVVRLLGVKSTRAKVILRNMVENNLLESLGENRSRRYVRKFNRSK